MCVSLSLVFDVSISDASIRYHGERADFSITNATKAKMTLQVQQKSPHPLAGGMTFIGWVSAYNE